MNMRVCVGAFAAIALLTVLQASLPAQENEARRRAYDTLLDLNVRDGQVYYRALKADRSRLDAYVQALETASLESSTRDEQIAFWLNAYNALVLQTVINHYPIQTGRSKDYPARSLRQVPGAFERLTHRVAGRTLTLDQIERTVLTAFDDPRVFLALGRASLGGGRLRSEAYAGASLERQLADVAGECVRTSHCFSADKDANLVKVSAVFSWREKEFVAIYGDKAPAIFSTRSPVERAALAFIYPKLLQTERDFIDRNEFKMQFIAFDWTLNDLTGR
jgi:hypothetical protein